MPRTTDDLTTEQQAAEQRILDVLYARLDAVRGRTSAELDRARRSGTAGTPAARAEREAFVRLHTERLAGLRGVEERLCFGRLDLLDGIHRYVGRVGLSDESGTQLLVDWRAPAAEPFFRATAANPGGVVLRRHLNTERRRVIGIEDEVLDLDAFDGDPASVEGEGALLTALNAARTGHMRDIVATIQAEQDRVIRAPLAGVLVVQGGPGTGKTAVALHRAAYLLYTHRERIARSGVLVLGPNPRFVHYIEQVLPSLGESGVFTTTVGALLPGLDAQGSETPAAEAVKGDPRMAAVVAAAIGSRQRVPDRPLTLSVDGSTVVMHPRDVRAARDRARGRHEPHNVARVTFVRDLLGRLARLLAAATGTSPDRDGRADLLAALRDSPDVRREVNLCWMPLTPAEVVGSLWASPDRLAVAAPWLTPQKHRVLYRERGAPWTPSDVPLLDEAAELLGEDDSTRHAGVARETADRRDEEEYARGVLDMFGGGGMLTAGDLLERYSSDSASMSVVEHATEDRSWTFGHVVVDEAQELSPMQWRMVMRRCPSRSMTVVGDVAQTGSAAGARSWREVLDPYAEGRWRVEELTVNYRTPREVMDLAAGVLAEAGVEARAPSSAREATEPPTAERVAPGELGRLVEVVAAEAQREGTTVVVTSRADRDAVDAAVRDALDGAAPPVLAVPSVKGLEFDAVVLYEPAALLAESPQGARDLYVAITRPTQRLRIVHAEPLPPALARLRQPPTGQPPTIER